MPLSPVPMDAQRRQKICVLGAGPAGAACAWSLSRFPEKFEVVLVEKAPVAGGASITTQVAPDARVNDGVQGGAPSYRNTMRLFEQVGDKARAASDSKELFHRIQLRVAFGNGETRWSNYRVSPFIQSQRKEIKRFGKLLSLMSALEPLFLILPIKLTMKLFGFSEQFRNDVVFPLVALFFGTGNQTPNVSSAIIARVFLDPELKLFDFDDQVFLSQQPDMYAFPPLQDVYEALTKSPQIERRTGTSVVKVSRHSHKEKPTHGATVEFKTEATGEVYKERFDHVVMACGADVSREVLVDMNMWERQALCNVTFFDDLIVTHTDRAYMDRMYEDALGSNEDVHYMVRSDVHDKEVIEMSFVLSNYQPQVHGRDPPIFQSIFLDAKNCASKWTRDEIDPSKVLTQRWWHQFAHTWRHFAGTVPFVRFLLRPDRATWFCGAYTLFNTTEIAITSGLAVADQLGAPYPFEDDELATKMFDTYCELIMGTSRSSLKKRPLTVALWQPIHRLARFLSGV
ncbi:hypothetical protein FVE85_5716 [Porphyridium purpureum]|uniref:Amine oxidase domain-containing protein n=1 Tax=Porphyridium purpureum TaxID=35688 RepID=A0A5J4Z2Q7_PORPP|nr:hypothetical protein FVE85_5716 [Porphyridium purpureum]|eukprot:POR3051..scf295_1